MDGPSVPCKTFQMWFLGLLFAGIQFSISQFFYMRQTTISIDYAIVALATLPLGHVFPLIRAALLYNGHVIGVMTVAYNGTAYSADINIIQELFATTRDPSMRDLCFDVAGHGIRNDRIHTRDRVLCPLHIGAQVLSLPPSVYSPGSAGSNSDSIVLPQLTGQSLVRFFHVGYIAGPTTLTSGTPRPYPDPLADLVLKNSSTYDKD
ncbi:hypothetical protein BGZ92_007229 [Podila epicladia]|nr:hypothetical protein BGZ92_007229 [Podila epicladia]